MSNKRFLLFSKCTFKFNHIIIPSISSLEQLSSVTGEHRTAFNFVCCTLIFQLFRSKYLQTLIFFTIIECCKHHYTYRLDWINIFGNQ